MATAYTSANVDFAYVNQEGNFQEWVLHLDALSSASSDTLDITPYVPTGMKACFVSAEDHPATVVHDVQLADGTTTFTTQSRMGTSMVVATDVITFGGNHYSADAHVNFKVVPGR